MFIKFPLPLFRDPKHSARDRGILAIYLDALTRTNRAFLSSGKYPPLLESGVRYRREPRGMEIWSPVPVVLSRGYGDCEDLACWYAAETAGTPHIIQRRRRGGGLLFHIVTRLPDDRLIDPSKILGMK